MTAPRASMKAGEKAPQPVSENLPQSLECIVRFMSGDEVALPACEVVRDVMVGAANYVASDKFAPDVRVWDMDLSRELRMEEKAPSMCTVLIMDNSAATPRDRWIYALKLHAEAHDRNGVARLCDVIQDPAESSLCASIALVEHLKGTGNDEYPERQTLRGCSNDEKQQTLTVEFVQILMEVANADASYPTNGRDGRTSIMWAAYWGYVEIVDYLLALQPAVANVDERDASGNTALHVAAMRGHDDVCELLLDHGYDVNAVESRWGKSVLCAALSGDAVSLPVVDVLINAGADVNWAERKTGLTPLITACIKGYVLIVRRLLKARQINIAKACDGPGFNAFHMACACPYGYNLGEEDNNGLALVRALLEAKETINPFVTDKFGKTALMYAVNADNAPVVELLLSYASSRDITMVKPMLNHGDFMGETALGLAAEAGNTHIVSMLLRAGATPDNAAIAAAEGRGHTVVVRLLRGGFNIKDTVDYYVRNVAIGCGLA